MSFRMNPTHQYVGSNNGTTNATSNSSLSQYKLSTSDIITQPVDKNVNNVPTHGSNDGMSVRSTVTSMEDYY
ncbi:MAG: hypothetical protein ACW98X_20795 [Promethearchaeota archaeon]|jgi:hypothetical protein